MSNEPILATEVWLVSPTEQDVLLGDTPVLTKVSNPARVLNGRPHDGMAVRHWSGSIVLCATAFA
jgi:hypothetical protein